MRQNAFFEDFEADLTRSLSRYDSLVKMKFFNLSYGISNFDYYKPGELLNANDSAILRLSDSAIP